MCNCYITGKYISTHFQIFMDCSNPFKLIAPFHQPVSYGFHSYIAVFISSQVILHSHRVNRRPQFFLQQLQLLLIFLQEHVIGIEPQDKVFGGFMKSEVPCLGKIINPFKVINTVRILGCNLFCFIA
ncbi:hypothetical protein D3C81_1641330 [compost metagenome]